MAIQHFTEGSHVLTPGGKNASVISSTQHGVGYQVTVQFAVVDPHQGELVLTQEKDTFGSSELTLVSGSVIQAETSYVEENYLIAIDD